jgi:hypothetical protein
MLRDGSDWLVSSRCGTQACVEVRLADGMVEVRDGKDRSGPVLMLPRETWSVFVAQLRG